MKLRLRRGEVKQIQGPVTGIRYLFIKQAGRSPVVDVDDRDALGAPGVKGFLEMVDGCCGVHYRMFDKVEE